MEYLDTEIMSKDELVELVANLRRAGERLSDAYAGAIWKHEGRKANDVANELVCRNWKNANCGKPLED